MKHALATLSSILLFLSADALAETITLTVHDYPPGDGPPGLANNGIPLKPGALFNVSELKLRDVDTEIPIAVEALARHGDNSIRAVLLQFRADFAERARPTHSPSASRPR